MKTLTNNELTIRVAAHGAELCSLVANATGREYLWQADPAFWKRHSPVLFPIVGGVWNNEYRHQKTTYPLSQHGFARDKDFTLIHEADDAVRYRLTDDEATRTIYPFPFELEIGYKLNGNQVEVQWLVKNSGTEEMHFQIGAHPAFFYPDFDAATSRRGYFAFDRTEGLEYILIADKGCVSPKKYPLTLTKGMLPLDVQTFDRDALIFEDSQLKRVSLLNKEQRPYITLHFTAPVLGLWSPPHKNAPFICIEPWYGRCDSAHYDGEFSSKDWMQHLRPGEVFEASYCIEVAGV